MDELVFETMVQYVPGLHSQPKNTENSSRCAFMVETLFTSEGRDKAVIDRMAVNKLFKRGGYHTSFWRFGRFLILDAWRVVQEKQEKKQNEYRDRTSYRRDSMVQEARNWD
jgi:hypothetical protein